MRKIILNLAVSLDGYICDNEGKFDWIMGQGSSTKDETEAYDFPNFEKDVDTLVMGSVCYEDVVLTDLATFEDKKILVASHRELEARANVEFIQEDICNRILELKEEEGKNFWLFGGAGLTDHFIKKDIVDEYVVAIIPVILGNGRRLFKENSPKIDLHLDKYSVNDGITVLNYSKR
jgi:dihydrofolate reductase